MSTVSETRNSDPMHTAPAPLPALPPVELMAVFTTGIKCRIIGFQGSKSPETQCLEAIPYVAQATWGFCAAAERALEIWSPALGVATVGERRRQIAHLRKDLLPNEQPYHVLGLTDGSRYVAFDDGVLLIRHADGHQEQQQFNDRTGASSVISRVTRDVAAAHEDPPRVARRPGPVSSTGTGTRGLSFGGTSPDPNPITY